MKTRQRQHWQDGNPQTGKGLTIVAGMIAATIIPATIIPAFCTDKAFK